MNKAERIGADMTACDAAELIQTLSEDPSTIEYLRALAAGLASLDGALSWYEDHKTADGSYDGELFGDLTARVTASTTWGASVAGCWRRAMPDRKCLDLAPFVRERGRT